MSKPKKQRLLMRKFKKLMLMSSERGWARPGVGAAFEPESWISYWEAMEKYDRAIAAGETDPGRPVVPHRSA